MKKSELKEMIKAAFLSEKEDEVVDPYMAEGESVEEDLDEMLARLSEEDDTPENPEDYKNQPGYISEEAEDEATDIEGEEEVDVDVDAEEETTDGGEEEKANDSIVIDKKIVSLSSLPGETRKILDTLETLRAQAEEFGDQKFITQVGNTITFFTRDFVVAGDAPNPAGIEEEIGDDSNTVEDEAGLGLEEIQRWKKLAGIAEIELPANIRNKANIEVKDAATMAKSLLDLYQQIQDKEQVNFSQNNDFKIALTYLKKLAKNVKGKEAPTQDDTTDMTMDMDVDVATTK